MKVLGKNPHGRRLERIQKSPNFKNGVFQNVHPTRMSPEGVSTAQVIREFIFTPKPEDLKPSNPIPSVRTNLKNLKPQSPQIIWFGHSSYLISYAGKNILVDPVFSGYAAPFSFLMNAFKGADTYQVTDLPPIDVLLITHDHYDHLDYKTVLSLKPFLHCLVMPLGVGAHFESWNFSQSALNELDWWESYQSAFGLKITATPARHFSGRSLQRFKSLWCSYVLEWDGFKIFVGGDSGYDDQFRKIGQTFGSMDLAILECGQYGKNWPSIHMFPEQTAQAAVDLRTEYLFPVHWGKFALSLHSWNESIGRVALKARELDVQITTPKIGEPIVLGQAYPQSAWWL